MREKQKPGFAGLSLVPAAWLRCPPRDWLRTVIRLRRTAADACVLRLPYLRAIRDSSPAMFIALKKSPLSRAFFLVPAAGLEPALGVA